MDAVLKVQGSGGAMVDLDASGPGLEAGVPVKYAVHCPATSRRLVTTSVTPGTRLLNLPRQALPQGANAVWVPNNLTLLKVRPGVDSLQQGQATRAMVVLRELGGGLI